MLQVLILIIGTPILYRLGGMGWHKIPRRYGIPLLFLGVAFWIDIFSLRILIAILGTMGMLTTGYGETHTWLSRICYALGLSVGSYIIGLTWWALLPPIIFLTTWILSNNPKTERIFTWDRCELVVGLALGYLWFKLLKKKKGE